MLRFRVAEPLDRGCYRAAGGPGRALGRGRVRRDRHQPGAQSVLATLTGAGIVALDLRLDRASLDDAFVALVREDEITTTSHEEIYS